MRSIISSMIVLISMPTALVLATQPSFQGLGDLSGSYFYSDATAISADGQLVVGTSRNTSGDTAYIWSRTGGMTALPDLAGGSYGSGGLAISVDGSVVVGRSTSSNGTGACKWYRPNPIEEPTYFAARGLGDLAGGSFRSEARAVSGDGSQVAGWGSVPTWNPGFSLSMGFHYSQPPAGGMGPLFPELLTNGELQHDIQTPATGISGDGSIVVGNRMAGAGAGIVLPFRWTTTGVTYLFSQHGGELGWQAFANAISADGEVIVGSSPDGAFRWTTSGGAQLLNTIQYSTALAVSADGSVIVGKTPITYNMYEPFVWDQLNGMRLLQPLLASMGIDLSGWQLVTATGISADGLTIVGSGKNPSGQSEGWIVTLPEPGMACAALLSFTIFVAGRSSRFERFALSE